MSISLWHHGLQHARFPCPSPSFGACSNSCPLSWWCHLTISSSLTRFLLLPSIFPSIRVFYNELALCIRWPKCWSFSPNPSDEYSGLISFRTDCSLNKMKKSLVWCDPFRVHICSLNILTWSSILSPVRCWATSGNFLDSFWPSDFGSQGWGWGEMPYPQLQLHPNS